MEGILSGEVPLLQSYLRSTGHAEKADLSRIIDIGLQEALAFLLEKDMTYAVKIFNNLVSKLLCYLDVFLYSVGWTFLP